jgi:hypothetical protein
MSTPSPSDAQRARQTAQGLLTRLNSDPAFKQQVEQDPIHTLTAAGLPGPGAEEFIRETGIGSEVMGYRECSESCWITCLVTHAG